MTIMKKRLVNTIQTLILKSDKDNTKKKTHRAILLINIDVKTLNKILSNLNLVIFSKDNKVDLSQKCKIKS